ncbi:hypothetical protein MUU53_16810 [Rhizobium lemnae]|uniref:Uncharacterized protein n=1 Tax=Rhizobium lemnae TaxID=1214924 RepID=A0ABV8EF37_9HYPH|nr:hypothetical protein [Rhizobium lemnae]MCJ8509569.1 hypothetical protein [Rhizobium lemnae]
MRGTPVVSDSEADAEFIKTIASELVGPEKVGVCRLIPGSEDFAYMLEELPGAFIRLGNGIESAGCIIRNTISPMPTFRLEQHSGHALRNVS